MKGEDEDIKIVPNIHTGKGNFKNRTQLCFHYSLQLFLLFTLSQLYSQQYTGNMNYMNLNLKTRLSKTPKINQ